MDDPVVRTTRSPSLRVRAARLGWLTAGLVGLSLALVAVAVWQITTTDGRATLPDTAVLPLSVEFRPPGLAVLLAAVALVAATFLALTALETATAMQVLNRDRRIPPPLPPHLQQARRWTLGPVAVRSLDLEHPPEWPALAVPSEGLPPGTRLRCTVLVPAHDEEAVIGATLRSLADQTRRPDRIIVIADNCTDATGDVARACGAEVVASVGNTEKKAGALNQLLGQLLPSLDREDVVLVMDADSTISPEFLETALGLLEDDADLMAVGGLFFGEEGGGLVGQLQRNEFGRYQRIVARRLDRVFVLTGTASVIRGFALSAVAQARGSLIPGPPGKVYDTLALTEDNELTLALKTLGARMTSPHRCRVTTEVMTSWRDLWRQRLRWHRGALENIGAYGFTRATAMYWTQQLALGYGVIALWSYVFLLAVTLLAADSIRWSPFWVTVGLVFLLERLVTVWAVGWRARALAAPVVIELAYAFFLQACFVTSIVQIATGRKAGWNYVPRPALQATMLPALAAYVVTFGIVLPSSLLLTDWYRSLSLWVAFNTLVFVVLSLLQLLPPLRRDARRAWARRGDAR